MDVNLLVKSFWYNSPKFVLFQFYCVNAQKENSWQKFYWQVVGIVNKLYSVVAAEGF